MSAEKLTAHWLAAGELMGFKVEAPYDLPLADGTAIRIAALLPEFGAACGMLLVYSFDEIGNHLDEIRAAGYGFSVLGPYADPEVNREAIIELLKDWGWSSRNPCPAWLG
jgi:hypothetical protein